MEGSHSRHLEAGTEAEAVEGRVVTAFFIMACSVCFVKHPRTTCPGVVLAPNGLSSPRPIMKKMPYQPAAYSSVLLSYFLNWGSFSSSDSSLCQVDIKLASTHGWNSCDFSFHPRALPESLSVVLCWKQPILQLLKNVLYLLHLSPFCCPLT